MKEITTEQRYAVTKAMNKLISEGSRYDDPGPGESSFLDLHNRKPTFIEKDKPILRDNSTMEEIRNL